MNIKGYLLGQSKGLLSTGGKKFLKLCRCPTPSAPWQDPHQFPGFWVDHSFPVKVAVAQFVLSG